MKKLVYLLTVMFVMGLALVLASGVAADTAEPNPGGQTAPRVPVPSAAGQDAGDFAGAWSLGNDPEAFTLLGTTAAGCPTAPNLPGSSFNIRMVGCLDCLVQPALGSVMDLSLTGIATGFGIQDATVPGWCADKDTDIYRGQDHSAVAYSSFLSYNDLWSVCLDCADYTIGTTFVREWDKANYILNNKWYVLNNQVVVASPSEVQEALWHFLSNKPAATLAAIAMVDAANAHANFCPSPGQVAAVILYVSKPNLYGARVQMVFVEATVGQIGDYVWEDMNANGIQDTGEPGIANVTVNLLNASNAVVATTTTDAGGKYLFTVLGPGNYQVEFVRPVGFLFTPVNAGSDRALDSDADPATGKTANIPLTSGQTDLKWDAGLYRPASLGDFVWQDTNGNGIQDAGEPGIENVSVQLYDCEGKAMGAPVATDANGKYLFPGLKPGDYSVGFTAAPDSGYVFTLKDQGTNDALDSDANDSGMTGCVTLKSGDNNPTVDAGMYKPASLGDFVWQDTNGNGIQDAGEPGIENVSVQLYDCEGKAMGAPVATDANGKYLFPGLKPGDYSVGFTAAPDSGYVFTLKDQGTNDALDSDANDSGMTGCVTLKSGDNNPTVDAGMYKPASLGDFVWQDTNGNGIQDAGEPGIENVSVQLYDCEGKAMGAPVATDANGKYLFSGLKPGDYSVGFTAAPDSGYVFTLKDQGTNDALDSDANDSGMTGCVTLKSGDNNPTVDAGMYKPASLGDFVWQDTNGNGIQDAGEPGIENVSVQLYDCEGKAMGAPVATDANGKYLFPGLKPGDYSVGFTAAPDSGYVFTLKDQGTNDALDSDANDSGMTGCVTLKSGDNNPTVDAGMYKPASLGDFVWQDTNGNGIQDAGEPGIENVSVQLYDCEGKAIGAPVATDANGKYLFPGLKPGDYSVGFTAAPDSGYVFTLKDQGTNDALDSDANDSGMTGCVTLKSGDNNPNVDAGMYKPASLGDFVWQDTNGNGIQDAGEPGIENVSVQLYDCEGKAIGAPVATDANGKYLFSGLKPGDYSVGFTAAPDSGYVFTLKDQGTNDALDSDANDSGMTGCVTLKSGDNNPTVDAGMYKPASLGDFVWQDTNGNGIQDAGEPGIVGVTVKLYDCTTDTYVASATTDNSGKYVFPNLAPGKYYVVFTVSSGYAFTAPYQGGDATKDSNADMNGKTGCVSLVSGDSDTTLDAGLRKPSIEVVKYVSRGANGPWYDANGLGSALSVTVPGQVYFRIVATNTGTVKLTDIAWNDVVVPSMSVAGGADLSCDTGSCPAQTWLDPGKSFTCLIGPVAAQCGVHTDKVTVTGKYGATVVSGTDTATYVGVCPAPSIEVVKYVSRGANGPWYDANGLGSALSVTVPGQVYFRIVATNTGTVKLTDIAWNDVVVPSMSVAGGADLSCDTGSCPAQTWLDPGKSFTCLIGPVAAQCGVHTDKVTVTGKYGATVVSDTDTATYVGVCPAPSIEVIKYVSRGANGPWYDANGLGSALSVTVPGQVYFRIVATNTGTVKLTDIAWNDVVVPSMSVAGDAGLSCNTGSCPAQTWLDPGKSFTCLIGPVAAQCGAHTDKVTVTGKYGTAVVSDTDTATYVGVCPAPSIEVVKYVSRGANGPWYDANGLGSALSVTVPGQVYFRIVATNTGTVKLTDIAWNDVVVPSMSVAGGADLSCDTGSCPAQTWLDPGKSFTCLIGPVAAQCGVHTDKVTVTGKYGATVVSDTDTATYVGVCPAPSIEVVKYVSRGANGPWYDANGLGSALSVTVPGQVYFRIVATNAGTVKLTDIAWNDVVVPSMSVAGGADLSCDTGSCPAQTWLDPGKSFTCLIGPVAAQCGVHTDKVTVTGKYGATVVTDTDTATYVGVCQTGKLTPTNTTCSDFANGTAADFGEVLYGVKESKVNNVAPGVFFYYTQITAKSPNFVIRVEQTVTGGFQPIGVHQGQIILYDANYANSSRQGGTTVDADGTVVINVVGATVGQTYYVGIKYNPGNLVGTVVTQPYPTPQYTFVTWVGGEEIATSSDILSLKSK